MHPQLLELSMRFYTATAIWLIELIKKESEQLFPIPELVRGAPYIVYIHTCTFLFLFIVFLLFIYLFIYFLALLALCLCLKNELNK